MKKLSTGRFLRVVSLIVPLIWLLAGSANSQIINTVAGNGTGGYSSDGVPATSTDLHNPTTIALDASGNLYIADWANARVRKVNTSGIISTVAGTGTSGYNGDNIPATAAQLKQPNGVAIDAAGNLYIAEMSGNRVRKVAASTGIITTIGGTGTAGDSGDGLSATVATVTSPTNVAIDGAGNIYVADWGNHKIRKISNTGIMSTVAGSGSAGFFGDGGPASAALLHNPYSVSLDALNNLYISDEHNYVLRKINLTTGIITTIAGTAGTAGYFGDGGPATAAQFNQPDGIVADAGALYIADFSNNRIRKVDLTTGIVTSAFGNGTGGFAGDGGPATAATVEINGPTGILLDVTGNVYISDYTNNRVREVSINNRAPFFDSGHIQHLGVCENGTINLTPYLAITDSDIGQTETWTLYSGPATGSIYNGATLISPGPVTVGTVTSTGGIVSMSGSFSYKAATGSTLPDSFVFRVNDGISIDSEKFYITIDTFPVTAPIAGPSAVCVGATIPLTDDTLGGSWFSKRATASINSSGVVTGITSGSTDSIFYVVYNTCGTDTAFKVITISTTPVSISPSGALTICTGGFFDLSDGTGGGTWSITNGNATVNGVGKVTGVTAGLDTVEYTIGSCAVTKPVTVNGPVAIAPHDPTICQGSTVLETDGSGGGSWSSGATGVATVSAGGLVTGITAGIAPISYTVGSCSAVDTVTVITSPAAISPATGSVCVGSTFTFTDGTGGGSWSVSNGHATMAGGTVTGVSAGIDTLTYTVGTCFVTAYVTVNTAPASINPSGAVSVCVGSQVSLTDGTSGGTWSSTAPGTATVGTSGTVTGITAGTTVISYTLGSCAALKTVTVNGPAAISPYDPSICASGGTVSLSDGSGGGTWTSGATGIATISSGGVVTPTGAAGIVPITYTVGSCMAFDTVTVLAGPASISPGTPVTICAGTSSLLTDGTSGGAWSSGTPGVATVSGGLVTGVTAGTATISYTVSGCSVTKMVTVSSAPTALSPASGNICTGNTVTFTESVPGGTWASSAPAVGSVAGGVVMGLTPGVTTITYSIGSCSVSAPVTVSIAPLAGAISGPTTECVGGAVTLFESAGSGTWSSGTPTIATVSGSGSVLGVSGGVATISYTVSNACGSVSTTYTINVVPAGVNPITGPSSVCSGTFITLADATSGGSWSSSNLTATVTGGGVVTGISPGTDTITYTVVNVCGASSATKVVSVGAFLTAGSITGATTVCTGSLISLTNLAPGGVWSVSNTHASVISGTVSGLTAGVDTVSYTVSGSCGSAVATHVVTVNTAPTAGAITGPTAICLGSAIPYTESVSGGAWSMTNGNATISVAGSVTPVTMGLDTIKYTVTNACGTASTTKPISIGAFLTAGSITGSGTVCTGTSVSLTDLTSGGMWSASNGHATVSGAGLVTGVTAGVDTISYTVTASCGSATATQVMTVNPTPVAGTVTGPSSLCIGSPMTYTDAAGGGVWSLTNATATVSATGLVTPVMAGTDTLVYTVTNSCASVAASQSISIGTLVPPAAILGSGAICVSYSLTLADATPGGSWSTSNGHAVVAGGVATGLSAGTDTIYYTIAGSCGSAYSMTTVTVSPLPSVGPIVGPAALCVGSDTTYTNSVPGGVWSISNGNATISGSGFVVPVSTGGDTISYTVTNSCGTALAVKAISIGLYPVAGSISGPTLVCLGSTITLTDAAPGGIWSSSDASASVSVAGVVDGLSSGSDTILYTVTTSCGSATATYPIGVGASAAAGAISGPAAVCEGALVTLTDAAPGGSWSSSNANATVTAAGVVTGILPGADTISYTVSGTCGVGSATYGIIVNALPVAGTISGPGSVCVGDSITLTDPAPGGAWSSSSSGAEVGASSGVVSGVAGGAATIMYTVSNACGAVAASLPVLVNALPAAGTISGPDSLCAGTSVTLTDPVPGGLWSAANTNATVSASGLVTGISAGADPISYTVTNMCGTSSTVFTVTVNTAGGAAITGSSSVCVGSGITLSAAVGGGIWSVSNATALMAGPGIVNGVSMGVDTVFYTVTGPCGAGTTTSVITINPVPAVAPISGSAHECAGSSAALTDITPGGIWTSSTPAVASIGSSTGIATGITVGIASITYTVTNIYGCPTSVSAPDTVSATAPATPAISGPSSLCPGASVTLSDSVTGGTWSSGTPAVATVGSASGVLTGITSGPALISYTVINACGMSIVTRTESVNPVPSVAAIGGTPAECPASTATVTDATGGGVWSSATPGVAIVGSATGVITGIATGTSVISYTVTNIFGCAASATILNTVNTAPVVAGIAGITHECLGSGTSFTDATPGGVWSSSNPSAATISVAGALTSVSGGVTTITYLVAGTGCPGFAAINDTVFTVPVATAIAGPTAVCAGGTALLTDASFGGTWSSRNAAVATISVTGLVSGVTTGADEIYYSVTNSCGSMIDSAMITVQAPATAGTITGGSSVCQGSSITLSDSASGGAWSVATGHISVSGGVVTGISGGVDTVKYTVTNACGSAVAKHAVTVSPLPYPGTISGYSSVCEGNSITLSETVAGGTWTSSNPAVATVSAGVVSGISIGGATISYTVSNSCGYRFTSAPVTVVSAAICHTLVGNPVNASDEITVYPNPATSVLTIQSPVPVSARVYNVAGKVVITQEAGTVIDISNLADGLYLVMLYDAGGTLLKTTKFAKVQ